MVQLAQPPLEEIAGRMAVVFEHYIDDRIAAGEDPASARAAADAQRRQLFPDGRPADGQHVFNVQDAGETVGLLWMGRPLAGTADTWYVFDIEIDENQRGRGLGRATMVAAERWAREHGGTRIALNVFGPNLVARSLYDSLGYQVMATAMFKDLAD